MIQIKLFSLITVETKSTNTHTYILTLFFLKIGTNIPKYLDDCPCDPHILVLGSLLEPQQVFVIVEGQGLERPNLIKAVDACFKLFYVLDINYPWQSSVTWEFIQKVIYCLDSKAKQKTSPAVIAMRTALNA